MSSPDAVVASAPAPASASFTAVLRPLLPFVWMVFAVFLCIGMLLGVLPSHVHGQLGLGAFWVGLAIGLQSFAALVTRAYGGALSDTRGPRRALLQGLLAGSASGLLLWVSSLPQWPAPTAYGLLLAGRVLLGFAESLVITGALAWAIQTVGVAHSGKVMAWNGIAMYGGLALGAPAGAWLAGQGGLSIVAWAVVVLPLLALPFAAGRQGPAPAGIARMPFYRVLGLVSLPGAGLALGAVGFSVIASFVALLFAERGWANAPACVTLFGASYIGARLFIAHWPDRYGGARIARYSLLVELLGQLLLWRADAPWQAFAGAALTGLGFSLVFPSFGVEAVRLVPAERRGSALGAYVAFFDLALGVVAPLAGLVAGGFGYPAVFLCGALCCLAAILVVGRLGGR
ncbi:MFS transporter [Niveibacterium sp. SC-1]|uniref:MFS transporter n=1 Tax=Niveibacterium sp. SC-1 TaxID=3135646 RepID=UPI00311D9E81